MGEPTPIHWLIALAVIVLLFGGGVLRGFGDAIAGFGRGLAESEPWFKVSCAILATLTVILLFLAVQHFAR
jgi:hypothetical protein